MSNSVNPPLGVERLVICRFIGGYCGKHGSVTAYRRLALPCVPFPAMEIELDGQSLMVEHSVEEDGWHIRWDASTGVWFFSVKDEGDHGVLRACDTIHQVVAWYESHGWEIDEFDDVRSGR